MSKHLAVALFLLPLTAAADEVYLKNGGRLTGEVVEDSPTRVVLEAGPGRVTVPRSRVARVVDSASPLERYADRAAALRSNDVEGWVALGRWAREAGLPTQARRAFEHALRLDPGNEAAHLGLGHVRVAGRWMSEDDSYRARGYVRFDGRWMSPEERDLLMAERTSADAERRARAESDLRVREAEARARQAEADARAAEAAARAAETQAAPADGIPLYPPWGGTVAGPIYGPGPGYGGVIYGPVEPPPPPVVVIVKPGRPRVDPRPTGPHGHRPGSSRSPHQDPAANPLR
jgi:hypothetical protein